MIELSLEDRRKCKKMLVWDDNESEAVERIVWYKVEGDNFPYVVVDVGYEKAFLEGKTIYIETYRDAKPIPEKKYRWMTHKEMFVAVTDGALLKEECGEIFNSWHLAWDVDRCKISYDWRYFDNLEDATWVEPKVEE